MGSFMSQKTFFFTPATVLSYNMDYLRYLANFKHDLHFSAANI